VGSFSDPEGLEGLAHFLGERVHSFTRPRSPRSSRFQRFDLISPSIRCALVLIDRISIRIIRGVRIWSSTALANDWPLGGDCKPHPAGLFRPAIRSIAGVDPLL